MNSKRPLENSNIERLRKMPFKGVTSGADTPKKKEFQFRVLLPNSTTIELKMSELRNEIPVKEVKELTRNEYDRALKHKSSPISSRIINWEHQDVHFTDAQLKEIRSEVNLCDFMPNKWHFLWLHDGSSENDAYEGVWDLNEDPDVLKEQPDEYTTETALANPTDNSLQSVRSNGEGEGERRLMSAELLSKRMPSFDSGLGRDGADGNNRIPVDDGGRKLVDLNQEVPSIDYQEQEIEGALPTLKTPKLELEDNLPTSSATISQKELEDDLLSSAMVMTDHNRELERLRFMQLHIQRGIKELQVKPRPLTSRASQYLREQKCELLEIKKRLDEENEAYTRAIEKFFMARDKYNDLSQIGSDIPIDEGPRRSQRLRKTPEWLSNFYFL